jgi:hypothetical protein
MMKDARELFTLSDEVYETVLQRILRSQLPMGWCIFRRTVAAVPRMSFLPVSEALISLELEGLLESSPRAGTRVRIPSRDNVQGHYRVLHYEWMLFRRRRVGCDIFNSTNSCIIALRNARNIRFWFWPLVNRRLQTKHPSRWKTSTGVL